VARRRRLMVSTRWRRTPSGKERNKALVRRWVQAFNDGDLDAVDDLVTDSYVRHDPNSPQVRGPEEEKQLIAMYRSAFPDLRFTIEDMVAEGDRVVIRVGISATHKGELLGIPPTRNRLTLSAIEIYRFEGGKIAEQWVQVDTLGMMQQLGAIPALG
jgi:steroid delta-isomerase-like uncharacterized protein